MTNKQLPSTPRGDGAPRLETCALPETADDRAPDGSEIRRLPRLKNGSACHCTLPAGRVSRAVCHRTVEEIWYCLSGAGEVWRKLEDQEEIVDARPGVGLTIPRGAHFQFRNTGTEPLCFIMATMPPWPGPDEAMPVPGRW